MSTATLIYGGRIICPASGIDEHAELLFGPGLAPRIGKGLPSPEQTRRVNASGCLVVPGLIDLASRLREPGGSRHASIASECRAALHAGYSRLVAQPDTRPVLDNAPLVQLVHERAERAAGAQVSVLGALTRALGDEALAEMGALREAGCIGLGNAGHLLADSNLLRRALQYASSLGLTVHLYPGDPWLAAGGVVHEGRVASRLGLPGQPASAELVGLARDLELVRDTGARVHFCRLSCADSVAMLARAKADGLPVSADVALHQLFLSEVELMGFNSLCHVQPPLRTTRDRDGLREGVASAVIDAICVDHQPLEADAKLAPFPATTPGISGLDTALGLGLRLVEDGLLTLSQWLQRCSLAPARILGVDGGDLQGPGPLDVVIIDPEHRARVDTRQFRSAGRNSPFQHWDLGGQVRAIWIQGEQRDLAG